MAAPHVAGVAALMLSINPDISYAVLKQMILDGADQRTNFTDYCVSGGRLNAAAVVGGGGIPLTYFSFDDWGLTAEDFTIIGDWSNNWSHAGTFFNAGFSTNSFVDLRIDTDKDGMPDWWEISVGLNRYSAIGDNGANGDPDKDGLNNYYEWLAGTNPFDKDTDRDGVSDFNEDADGDGLSNGQEQNVTRTDAGLLDTDDDGRNDADELHASTDPLRSYSPENPRAFAFNGAGRLKVQTERNADVMTNWMVEAWVQPADTNVSGIVLRRAEKYGFPVGTSGFRWVDYEIGVVSNVPYATYAYRQGPSQIVVRVNGIVPLGTNWTHIAAVHDSTNSHLRLYVNGKRVAFADPAEMPPASGYGVFETVIGGGDLNAGGSVLNGFRGKIDAVRVWNYVRSGVEIQDNRGTLFPSSRTTFPMQTARHVACSILTTAAGRPRTATIRMIGSPDGNMPRWFRALPAAQSLWRLPSRPRILIPMTTHGRMSRNGRTTGSSTAPNRHIFRRR